MDALFHGASLRDVFEQQEAAARAAIDQIAAAEMREGDETAIVSQIVDRFRIAPIQFTEGAISAEAEEAQVDVSGNWDRDTMHGGPHYVPGVRVSYFVPFTGDKELFRFQPSTFSFHLPRAEVRSRELAFHFTDPDSNVAATKSKFDAEFRHVKEWTGWVNRDVDRFNATLPATMARLVAERRTRLRQVAAGANSLGIPIRSKGAPTPVPPTTRASAGPPAPSSPPLHYDVALSFAGEDRPYVEEVAEALKAKGIKVFYDAYEKVDMWGKNLVEHFADVYQRRSRFVVMFVSKHYVQKAWPRHERRHAQARALVAKEEYILPARFDDTDVPGMTSTVAYVDLRAVAPKEFAAMIERKLR